MGTVKLKRVRNFSSLWQKTKGVIGEVEPADYGDGIALPDTNSIHTFFVGFSLDLVFLNRESKIVRLVENLKPWRISPIVFGTKTVLELKQGSIKHLRLKVGDWVSF